MAIYGDTVFFGDNLDGNNGSASGLGHIFIQIGVTWLHQTKLLAPDGSANNYFGGTIGIYGDIIIIGAHMDDNIEENSGSAHVFIRNEVNSMPIGLNNVWIFMIAYFLLILAV